MNATSPLSLALSREGRGDKNIYSTLCLLTRYQQTEATATSRHPPPLPLRERVGERGKLPPRQLSRMVH